MSEVDVYANLSKLCTQLGRQAVDAVNDRPVKHLHSPVPTSRLRMKAFPMQVRPLKGSSHGATSMELTARHSVLQSPPPVTVERRARQVQHWNDSLDRFWPPHRPKHRNVLYSRPGGCSMIEELSEDQIKSATFARPRLQC